MSGFVACATTGDESDFGGGALGGVDGLGLRMPAVRKGLR